MTRPQPSQVKYPSHGSPDCPTQTRHRCSTSLGSSLKMSWTRNETSAGVSRLKHSQRTQFGFLFALASRFSFFALAAALAFNRLMSGSAHIIFPLVKLG